MTHRADPSGDRQPRSATRRRRRVLGGKRSMRTGVKVLAALVAAVVILVTGIGWLAYRSVSTGITKSDALVGEPTSPPGSDQNILIMGLDSRRDQQGRPLPSDIYDALHAGDENSGDNDSDALMVLHLPAGGGPATAISIPRDDYVDLAGCPTSDCRGKVKEAYSFAYQRVLDRDGSSNLQSETARTGARDSAAQEQAAREAGRKAEVATVRRLLQIPIDHFIEVSLAGFFQIARAVEPITVCVNEDTSDRYYSGANFHQGVQQISAAQAMAFVRQRRAGDDGMFTDLDRTRRQQAFIASVVSSLRRSGVLSNPVRMHTLLDIAKQNVAVDAGFDLEEFLRTASEFRDRPVALYTLPVTDFRQISDGEDVNIIDVDTIRSIVHGLLDTSSSAAASTSTTAAATTAAAQPADGIDPAAGSVALNVIDASGKGQAADIENAFATGQFTQGTVSTADFTRRTTTITYGVGAKAAAGELADELDVTAIASQAVAPNAVQLTVGTDFRSSEYLNHTLASPTTTTAVPVTPVPATATGTQAPAATDLTRMTADDIPCVK